MSPGPVLPPSTSGRAVLLVDAGYLYAAAGDLLLATPRRREFRVDAPALLSALAALAAETVHVPLLRVYWYDAARDRVPTVEQRAVARLSHVKVRLGNLNAGGVQKGVDALLRSDLEALARHGAITDALLLGGDEDLLPAVEAAQAYGVRLHLWGVEPRFGVNQSERLVWEADTTSTIDAAMLRPHVTGVEPRPAPSSTSPTEVGEVPSQPTPAQVVADAAAHATARPGAPLPSEVFGHRHGPPSVPPPANGAPASRPVDLGPDLGDVRLVGEHVAHTWLVTRGRDNLADLLPGPMLPSVIDHELLVAGESQLGRSLRPWDDARRVLREGFWDRLYREFGIRVGTAP